MLRVVSAISMEFIPTTVHVEAPKRWLHIGNGEVVPVLHQAPRHEDVWGRWGITSLILKLGTRRRWM